MDKMGGQMDKMERKMDRWIDGYVSKIDNIKMEDIDRWMW